MTAAEISAIVAVVIGAVGAIAGGAYKGIQWVVTKLDESQARADKQTKSMLEWQADESDRNRTATAELMRELQKNWLEQSVGVMREMIATTEKTHAEVIVVKHTLDMHNARVDGIVSDLQDIRRATSTNQANGRRL